MNALTSLSVVGVGQFLTAATLLGSMLTSPCWIIISRYSISCFSNLHFQVLGIGHTALTWQGLCMLLCEVVPGLQHR